MYIPLPNILSIKNIRCFICFMESVVMDHNGSLWKPKLILLCSGTSDSTVGDIPEGYHNILTENRVDHIWYLYPDGGHSYEVWLSGLINLLLRM